MLGKYQRCISCMKEIGTNNVCPYCGYIEGSPSLPDYLPPKTVLNQRYLIGKLLRYNGEGAVYIAFDTVVEAPVEIREYMPDALCDRIRGEKSLAVKSGCEAKYKALMSDFIDLIQQLTKMRTLTTVVRAYEVFEENNTVYGVFEHVEGITLRQYLNENAGEISWEEASKLFFPLFNTLAAIHSANVVHRGISPETVFITAKGEVKLSGFSISPLRAVNTELSPELYGGYAAPEQYSTNSWHGTWTDVYALAAVIYKSLTGTMPPEATTRSVNDNLIAPHILNPSVPKQVSNAIMAALVMSSEKRTQTITEFKNNLYNTEAASPISTAQKQEAEIETEPEEKGKKGLPAWAIALIVTSAVLLVALGILLVFMLGDSSDDNGSYITPGENGSNISSVISEASSQEKVSSKGNSSLSLNDFALENFVKMNADTVLNSTTYTQKYTFETEYVWDENYAYGVIVKQEPEEGTPVKIKAKVKLYISNGSQFVKLPEHQNMLLEDYEAELRRRGISDYTIEEEENEGITPGYVVRTNLDGATYDKANKDKAQLIIYVSKEKPEESSEPDYNDNWWDNDFGQ